MTTKVQRQSAVAQIISESDVTSHTQLVRSLKKMGIVATQATVSRDLEELGAVKVRTSNGETAYAIPEFEPERIATAVLTFMVESDYGQRHWRKHAFVGKEHIPVLGMTF